MSFTYENGTILSSEEHFCPLKLNRGVQHRRMDGSVIRPTNAVAAHSGDLSNLSPVTTTMPLMIRRGPGVGGGVPGVPRHPPLPAHPLLPRRPHHVPPLQVTRVT